MTIDYTEGGIVNLGDMQVLEILSGTITGAGTSQNVSLSAAVDLTKSAIIVLGTRISADGVFDDEPPGAATARFNGDSSVTLTRNAPAASISTIVDFMVVEFTSAVSVNYYAVSATGQLTDTAITAVSLTNRVFILQSNRATDTTRARSVVTAQILNATTARLERGGVAGNSNVEMFVVELNP